MRKSIKVFTIFKTKDKKALMKFLHNKKYMLPLLIGTVLISAWILFHVFIGLDENSLAPVQAYQKSHFVGSQHCKECHEIEYEDWKKSDHNKAMQVASEETVLGDFNNTKFQSKGFTSKMFRKDSSYYMVLENRQGIPDTFEVKYTFGHYPLQQYLIEFPGGRYQCTHIAWDSRDSKWLDLYPELEIHHSEWLHWTGRAQTWNNMCADCHSTNLQKNYTESTGSYRTSFDEINVSCESCHGPGSEHVRLSKLFPDSSRVFGEVYLGRNSNIDEQMQFCARCHSRRSQVNNSFNHNEHWMQQYSPDILRPGLYYPDGQILDEVYVWGSFTQSRMYREGVRCTDCHDPHTYERKLPGNQLCSQCHDFRVYDNESHHFHKPGSEGAQCESCHMPGRYYMVNDYRPDHSFRVPRPDLSVKYDGPNACNKCHDDRSAQWASDWINEWHGEEREFHFSEVLLKAANHESSPKEIAYLLNNDTIPNIAKATAIYYLDYYGGPQALLVLQQSLKHPSVLVRRTAVEGISQYNPNENKNHLVQMLFDTARVVRLAAFTALAGVDISTGSTEGIAQYNKVSEEFFSKHSINADFPSQKLTMAQYYHRLGETGMAQKYYEETLEQDNYQNMARLNLAYIHNAQNQNHKAVALLKKVTEQEPGYDHAWYSLGLVYAEMNLPDSAIYYMQECTKINNQNAPAYYNLGLLYQQQKETTKAENAFLEGLKNNPDNERLLYAITHFYLKEGKKDHAREFAQKLVSQFPNRIEYRELLRLTE
jgi:tetratricopeptide (TPR) repeat protein/nitrate/TMAO reductase-like tetraheme cytochrome c subunit